MFGDGKLSRIFAILAATLICAGQAFAQSSLKVVNATGAAGSDVTVKVTLTSDKNIAGAEFQVQFDPARLTFKQAAKGAAAAALHMTDPVVPTAGQQTVGSDSSKLQFQLIDSTRANSIASGTDREVVLITFTIKTGVSGSIPLTLTGASLSDAAGAAVTVTTANGEVTVGSAVDIALDVTDAQGPAGADVTVKVMANVNRQATALGFDLLYDKDKLTLKSISRGANAPGVDTLDTYSEIAAANAAGKFSIWMVDFFFDTPDTNPLKAGTNREVYKFTFTIKAGVADGETPVTLANIKAVASDAAPGPALAPGFAPAGSAAVFAPVSAAAASDATASAVTASAVTASAVTAANAPACDSPASVPSDSRSGVSLRLPAQSLLLLVDGAVAGWPAFAAGEMG